MKRALQWLFLGVYRIVLRTGLLSTAGGRSLYECCYRQYKRWIEVGDVQVLRTLVKPGSSVLDVGANVGFFTRLFAQWVTNGGRVIALEPEAANYARLQWMVNRNQFGGVVDTIQAAVAETSGTLNLAINPIHPADHKLADQGVPVRALTLDDLLAKRAWPMVSLIKVDVQGAEERVLRGAATTLAKFHPAVFIEIDDAALRNMNSSARAVLALFDRFGYCPHRLGQGQILAPLRVDEALRLCHNGKYADFLFIHPEAGL